MLRQLSANPCMATEIAGSVNRQSCEWLREVAIRLSVVIEVIDARHVLVCPVGSTLEAAAVRRMLTGGEHFPSRGAR
jgi:hypothetical protein